ncbi:MAG TPA: hypothetical protein VE031_10850 [Chthoniobacterales bacterium]|nr:hypothetical protein [Chthoniobacterales bacterium]
MQRVTFLVIAALLVLPGIGLWAEPPAKPERTRSSRDVKKTTNGGPTRNQLIESANGWIYVNGEWVHPDGYKFVNNKVLRTTAKAGKTFPNPPGKLALENPAKLTPRNKSAGNRSAAEEGQTAAEKATETRRKNLTPTPASQTGTHL